MSLAFSKTLSSVRIRDDELMNKIALGIKLSRGRPSC